MTGPAEIGPNGRGRRAVPLLRTMLGDVLRQTRRKQGRTLADVARAAQVSMPYLSELERGRKEASSEILAAICAALGIELADLLAAAGQYLPSAAGDRARRARLVRLETARSRRDPAQPGSPAVPARDSALAPGSAPEGRSDTALCLLAA